MSFTHSSFGLKKVLLFITQFMISLIHVCGAAESALLVVRHCLYNLVSNVVCYLNGSQASRFSPAKEGLQSLNRPHLCPHPSVEAGEK